MVEIHTDEMEHCPGVRGLNGYFMSKEKQKITRA